MHPWSVGGMAEYAPGTFNWVDLMAQSIDVVPFYEGLFDWTYQEQPGHGGPPYGFFLKDGKSAAGIGIGAPHSAWNTYVTVEDVDATYARALELGAEKVFEPMMAMEAGKMAYVRDPEGAQIALWQPMQHFGAEIVNVPGSFCWNERSTRNLADMKSFYGELFGWTYKDDTSGPSEVSMIHNRGREIGHFLLMTEAWGDMPPSWSVYFAVEDCDATCAKAQGLGGQVPVPPMDIAPGRFAVVTDTEGASFYAIKLNEQFG